MLTPKDAWQATLSQLQIQLNRATFDTWLKGSELAAYDNGEFTIRVRHAYAKDWLEKHLHAEIVLALSSIFQRDVTVRFVVNLPPRPSLPNGSAPLFAGAEAERPAQAEVPGPAQKEVSAAAEAPAPAAITVQTSAPAAPPVTAPAPAKSYAEWDPRVTEIRRTTEATPGAPLPDSPFNRLFTFERFATGPSNQFAFAAAKAVAAAPGESYNPLVIYGGVGLGKTHLLHAIGHATLAAGKPALVITGEEFTNALVAAIKTHTTDALRERYRSVDVLLLDDVQFLAGKTSSEEEFLHTFNTLFSLGKQIVVTCNQHPRQLATLDDRIRSRLAGGLLADIQAPEVDTRLAILTNKSAARGTALPAEVAGILAQQPIENVRELEGLLTQLLARATLTSQPLSVALAGQVLSHHTPSPLTRRTTNISDVLQATATYHQLSLDDLLSKRRTKEVVRARQIAMYLAREETDASLPEIGAAIGGRNHSTVLYGYQKIAKSVEADAALRREVSEIRRQLMLLPKP
ncbi:MAG: chromosomal replication initiator protein DnaA [Anaerolineae bacterium]|nr:chromosomal replication initiator protein DnaA [Anaerolineae bacterium]